MRRAGILVATCSVALGVSACSTSGPATAPGSAALKVVAAENFWGSIAAQLGGDRATVTSIITSPDADPHDYEPRAGDARAIASADVVVFTGAGYDPWAAKLQEADGSHGQTTVDVGKLVGVKEGDNPHRWYSPPDVERVVDRISSEYQHHDSHHAAYFADRKAAFESSGLARYHRLVAAIRRDHAGTAVGASESIFAPLAEALGLDLVTPASFLNAVSEGADPTARDKAVIDDQIKSGAIRLYVYNSQNSTPDVRAQVDEARTAGIPVASVTETLVPADASFQDWQADQLESIQTALSARHEP